MYYDYYFQLSDFYLVGNRDNSYISDGLSILFCNTIAIVFIAGTVMMHDWVPVNVYFMRI